MAGYNPLYTQQLMDKYGVAWFKFDEASGNVTDSKGTAIGTVNGTTRVSGWNGNGSALNFNGTNSYVSFTSPVLPTSKKSIRFKIKCLPNTLTSYFITNVRNFNSSYKGEMFAIDTNGMLGYGYWNGTALVNSITTSISIADNQWHDILFTWDGTTNTSSLKLYVDNMLIPNVIGTATVNALTTTSNLYLGTQQDGISTSGRNLNGILDELEIYNEVINPIANKFLISSINGIYISVIRPFTIDLTPTMTGVTAPSPYQVLQSSQYSSVYSGWKVFDKNLSTVWMPNDNSPYITLDFGYNTKINAYGLTSGDATGNPPLYTRIPLSFNLYGSNDNLNWSLIDSKNSLPVYGISEKRVFDLNKNENYRYYKLTDFDKIGTALAIGEISFYYKQESSIKELESDSEQNFINYGIDISDLPLINPKINLTKKEYHKSINTTLGNGKTFEHNLDLNKYKINKITIE